MLLNINKATHLTQKRTGMCLKDFNLDERRFQDILFKTMDRLFPDDELILLMQSARWREEPDLMAIDKTGRLYIFELKAWESDSSNLLQVLRYAQIYGRSSYTDLNIRYRKHTGDSQSLQDAFEARFGYKLAEEEFNRKQVFVVMTNGLDYKTREALKYWRSCGLDIRPWVYRVYDGNNDDFLVEMSAFRVEDNPYEDIAEGYYVLNTNFKDGKTTTDHDNMLKNHKAAAYFDPWKFKIERLTKGDCVFLYQSGKGIVAMGRVDGKLVKKEYQSNPEHPDEEYSMKLLDFQLVDPPLAASQIKSITGINHFFMQTMFGLSQEAGKAIRKFVKTQTESV